MTPEAIEVHALLFILIFGLFILKFVTIAFLIALYTNVRALRRKMRLMGFKLADENDIKEYYHY